MSAKPMLTSFAFPCQGLSTLLEKSGDFINERVCCYVSFVSLFVQKYD